MGAPGALLVLAEPRRGLARRLLRVHEDILPKKLKTERNL
ncbi:putative peptidase C14, caspase catalytic subunit p20 [Streptomyces sp. Tu6071]|nr:putative peptidase C14, caspase catalytic subunit p20 [Streptomyces sp. Tu6071]